MRDRRGKEGIGEGDERGITGTGEGDGRVEKAAGRELESIAEGRGLGVQGRG